MKDLRKILDDYLFRYHLGYDVYILFEEIWEEAYDEGYSDGGSPRV